MTEDLAALLPKEIVVSIDDLRRRLIKESKEVVLEPELPYDPVLNVPSALRTGAVAGNSFNFERFLEECRQTALEQQSRVKTSAAKTPSRHAASSVQNKDQALSGSRSGAPGAASDLALTPPDLPVFNSIFDPYSDCRCSFYNLEFVPHSVPMESKAPVRGFEAAVAADADGCRYAVRAHGTSGVLQCRFVRPVGAFRPASASSGSDSESSQDGDDCPGDGPPERFTTRTIRLSPIAGAVYSAVYDLPYFSHDIQDDDMSQEQNRKSITGFNGFSDEDVNPCSQNPLSACDDDEDDDDLSNLDLDSLDLPPALKQSLAQVLEDSSLPFAVAYTARRKEKQLRDGDAASLSDESRVPDSLKDVPWAKDYILFEPEDVTRNEEDPRASRMTPQRQMPSPPVRSPYREEPDTSVFAEDPEEEIGFSLAVSSVSADPAVASSSAAAAVQTVAEQGAETYRPTAVLFEDFVKNLSEQLEMRFVQIDDRRFCKHCLLLNQFGEIMKVLVYFKATGEITKIRCNADSRLSRIFSDALSGRRITTEDDSRVFLL